MTSPAFADRLRSRLSSDDFLCASLMRHSAIVASFLSQDANQSPIDLVVELMLKTTMQRWPRPAAAEASPLDLTAEHADLLCAMLESGRDGRHWLWRRTEAEYDLLFQFASFLNCVDALPLDIVGAALSMLPLEAVLDLVAHHHPLPLSAPEPILELIREALPMTFITQPDVPVQLPPPMLDRVAGLAERLIESGGGERTRRRMKQCIARCVHRLSLPGAAVRWRPTAPPARDDPCVLLQVTSEEEIIAEFPGRTGKNLLLGELNGTAVGQHFWFVVDAKGRLYAYLVRDVRPLGYGYTIFFVAEGPPRNKGAAGDARKYWMKESLRAMASECGADFSVVLPLPGNYDESDADVPVPDRHAYDPHVASLLLAEGGLDLVGIEGRLSPFPPRSQAVEPEGW